MRDSIHRIMLFIAIGLMFLTANSVWGVEGKMKEIILKVDGMTCPSCPPMVKTALKRLDGVNEADVSYKEAKAVVRYQEGKVTVEQMIKAIEGIWMKASLWEKK